MSVYGTFEKDGKWWVYDYVDIMNLEGAVDPDAFIGHLREEIEDLRTNYGWQDLKLVIGGRFDTCVGVRGVRPETKEETDKRLQQEKAEVDYREREERREYERLKVIYGK